MLVVVTCDVGCDVMPVWPITYSRELPLINIWVGFLILARSLSGEM